MKILVLSESFIIRDSLNHLLNETLNTNDIITSSNANHLSNEDLLEVDLSFIDINKNNINIVERLSKIRNKFENLKIMILDSQKDIELFIKSVDYGIDGYILNIDDKDEFIYMIDCQYKCNILCLCCSKDFCRCFIFKTLARSIIYYIYYNIKLILSYSRKIKSFRIKLS